MTQGSTVSTSSREELDPDRFLGFHEPGSQEWWYFDAISDDGRDALVLIWFAALPFDPAYGVATRRHLKNPSAHTAPHPLDFCALSVNWYRDGKLAAYALNSYESSRFEHRHDPFGVAVAGNRVSRSAGGVYDLKIETPAVDGRSRIDARFRFAPARGCEPFERNLGTVDAPHHWILVAADGRVEGELVVNGRRGSARLDFQGRGYHDHNAGRHDLSIAMQRWAWGRVHEGSKTHIVYHATPRPGYGSASTLWMTCHDGRVECVRERLTLVREGRGGNAYGVRHGRRLIIADASESIQVGLDGVCVDDGPFYRRWVSPFQLRGAASPSKGICEWLDTRHLHSPLFNWMIPYRLKRPKS